MAISFVARTFADVTVAKPEGRIDHTSAEDLKLLLQNLLDHCVAGAGSVVLDFSKVDYISSVGLRVLMLAAKQVKTQQGRLVIAGLTPVVKEIFEISRFHMVFEIFASVPDALARMSAAAAAAYKP